MQLWDLFRNIMHLKTQATAVYLSRHLYHSFTYKGFSQINPFWLTYYILHLEKQIERQIKPISRSSGY